MVAYSIGLLPPIKRPRVAYPDVTQPGYADDYSALGKFHNVELYFISVK